MESEAVRRLMMALEDANLHPQVLTEDSILIFLPQGEPYEVTAKFVDASWSVDQVADTEIEFSRPSERALGMLYGPGAAEDWKGYGF